MVFMIVFSALGCGSDESTVGAADSGGWDDAGQDGLDSEPGLDAVEDVVSKDQLADSATEDLPAVDADASLQDLGDSQSIDYIGDKYEPYDVWDQSGDLPLDGEVYTDVDAWNPDPDYVDQWDWNDYEEWDVDWDTDEYDVWDWNDQIDDYVDEDQPDTIPWDSDFDTDDIPPNYASCCKGDIDCPAGMKCVGAAFASGGWCVQLPKGDECYTLNDCPMGHLCKEQEICSCTGGCDATPGYCAPMPGWCCQNNSDCDPGYMCVETTSLSTCEPIPPFQGKCWTDDHCSPGKSCQGAFACPCSGGCTGLDEYGDCI